MWDYVRGYFLIGMCAAAFMIVWVPVVNAVILPLVFAVQRWRQSRRLARAYALDGAERTWRRYQ